MLVFDNILHCVTVMTLQEAWALTYITQWWLSLVLLYIVYTVTIYSTSYYITIYDKLDYYSFGVTGLRLQEYNVLVINYQSILLWSYSRDAIINKVIIEIYYMISMMSIGKVSTLLKDDIIMTSYLN